MEDPTLCFYGSDPGAVKFGNFINYYSFHTVQERIDKLCHEMFPIVENTDLFCLDIGCNSGDLTKELSLFMKRIYPNHDVYILAIDIDPTLIQRAQETNKNSKLSFLTCNIMNNNDKDLIYNYLNLRGRNCFDVTFCFSVTMWIHLNNGDDGLLEFLKYIKHISKTIIIEPQPWNCYRSAQRRLKKSGKSFQFYNTLKLRNNIVSIIETVLSENPFIKKYESDGNAWQRKVKSFTLGLIT